jgi:hypothetical protein
MTAYRLHAFQSCNPNRALNRRLCQYKPSHRPSWDPTCRCACSSSTTRCCPLGIPPAATSAPGSCSLTRLARRRPPSSPPTAAATRRQASPPPQKQNNGRGSCHFRAADAAAEGPLALCSSPQSTGGRPDTPVPSAASVTPQIEAANYAAALARVAQEAGLPFSPCGAPRLDLVLLGVGADGHVGSLYPGGHALDASPAWVLPVLKARGPASITLSLPVINAARSVVVSGLAGAACAGGVGRCWRVELPAVCGTRRAGVVAGACATLCSRAVVLSPRCAAGIHESACAPPSTHTPTSHPPYRSA